MIMETTTRSQEAHKKDMKILRKIVLRKQKEIDRLCGQLCGQLNEAVKHVAERSLQREKKSRSCVLGVTYGVYSP